MERRITLKDWNMIKIEEYHGQVIINKAYMKEGVPSSIVTLSMNSDFNFDVCTFSDDETDSVSFSVPAYDPLYKHLSSALGEKDELFIDDDLKNEEMRKYMRIKREEQGISINFHNDIKGEFPSSKFAITVINVMSDGRSKIDQAGLDTKDRLAKFFRRAAQELLVEKDRTEER